MLFEQYKYKNTLFAFTYKKEKSKQESRVEP